MAPETHCTQNECRAPLTERDCEIEMRVGGQVRKAFNCPRCGHDSVIVFAVAEA